MPVEQEAALRAVAQQIGALGKRCVKAVERGRGVAQRELRAQQHLAIGGLLALKAADVFLRRDADLRRAAVERGQHGDQRIDVPRSDSRLGDQVRKHAIRWQASHQHQPVDCLPAGVQEAVGHEGQAGPRGLQDHQSEIDTRRQARVQAKLFAAVELSRAQRREVEVRESHRLLQLEHPICGEEQPRHVGLQPAQRRPRVRIRGGRSKKAQLGVERSLRLAARGAGFDAHAGPVRS